jgi:hypothetical protein
VKRRHALVHDVFRSAEMLLARHVVVVTVDRLEMCLEGLHHQLACGIDCMQHHDLPIGHSEALYPIERLEIIIEMRRLFRKIRENSIQQIDVEALHILLGEFDEIESGPI